MKRVGALLLAMLAAPPPAAADLHALWDGQCGGCHGHAGDFARRALAVRQGVLYGRDSRRPVAEYLIRHNGGYSPAQVVALQTMLTAQVISPPEYRLHCGGCHDSAAQVVRDWLVRRDATLALRSTGKPVADFLRRHGGADAESRARIVEALTRIASEVNHR